jgi:hypothetical protein
MRHLFLKIMIALAAVMAFSGVAAGANTDLAKGTIRNAPILVSTSLGGTDLVFTARSNFNGFDATGSAKFTSAAADPNPVINGDVTCLRVAVNVATIGGVVTDVRGGSTFFNSFLIFAMDSGKFAATPDTWSVFLFTSATPPDCATAAPGLIPLADGEIIVQDN